jgi:hypothetical protein
MKKILGLIITIAMCLFASDASAQFIPVTTPSSCITDGSGAAMASGTMIVVGTDANDNPIPYRAGTSTMATTAPISRTITAGALATSLQLADPGSSSPTGVLYRFAIQDNLTKKITLYKQIVVSINDLGTNFNFCKMNPLPFTTQILFAAAPFSFSSDWNLLGNLSVAKSTQLCASTVTFSATPTFNAGVCNGWKITLTANVTSSTLSGALVGEPLFFEVCQDATGGRSFVPPTNVIQWTSISTAANTCTLQIYWYDGTNAIPDVMPGLTGDVNSSAGFVATTVVKVDGVSYPASPSLHGIPVVTASNTVTYKVIPDCTDTTGNHLNYTQSTDTWSCGTTANSAITNAVLTRATINTGVSQGSGFKHQRFGTTCSTAATAGTTCPSTLTWTSAFVDASYTVSCVGSQGSGVPILTQSTKAAASIAISVWAATASAASFSSVDCIAVHD